MRAGASDSVGNRKVHSSRHHLMKVEILPSAICDNVDVLKMSKLDEIRARQDEIYAIARRRKAEKLWAFGSCACGEVAAI